MQAQRGPVAEGDRRARGAPAGHVEPGLAARRAPRRRLPWSSVRAGRRRVQKRMRVSTLMMKRQRSAPCSASLQRAGSLPYIALQELAQVGRRAAPLRPRRPAPACCAASHCGTTPACTSSQPCDDMRHAPLAQPVEPCVALRRVEDVVQRVVLRGSAHAVRPPPAGAGRGCRAGRWRRRRRPRSRFSVASEPGRG